MTNEVHAQSFITGFEPTTYIMYKYTKFYSIVISSSSSSSSSCSSSSSSSTVFFFVVAVDTPLQKLGCFQDNGNRALLGFWLWSSRMYNELCVSICAGMVRKISQIIHYVIGTYKRINHHLTFVNATHKSKQ